MIDERTYQKRCIEQIIHLGQSITINPSQIVQITKSMDIYEQRCNGNTTAKQLSIPLVKFKLSNFTTQEEDYEICYQKYIQLGKSISLHYSNLERLRITIYDDLGNDMIGPFLEGIHQGVIEKEKKQQQSSNTNGSSSSSSSVCSLRRLTIITIGPAFSKRHVQCMGLALSSLIMLIEFRVLYFDVPSLDPLLSALTILPKIRSISINLSARCLVHPPDVDVETLHYFLCLPTTLRNLELTNIGLLNPNHIEAFSNAFSKDGTGASRITHLRLYQVGTLPESSELLANTLLGKSSLQNHFHRISSRIREKNTKKGSSNSSSQNNDNGSGTQPTTSNTTNGSGTQPTASNTTIMEEEENEDEENEMEDDTIDFYQEERRSPNETSSTPPLWNDDSPPRRDRDRDHPSPPHDQNHHGHRDSQHSRRSQQELSSRSSRSSSSHHQRSNEQQPQQQESYHSRHHDDQPSSRRHDRDHHRNRDHHRDHHHHRSSSSNNYKKRSPSSVASSSMQSESSYSSTSSSTMTSNTSGRSKSTSKSQRSQRSRNSANSKIVLHHFDDKSQSTFDA